MLKKNNHNRYFKISNIKVNKEYGNLIISLNCKINTFANKIEALNHIENLAKDILNDSNLGGVYCIWNNISDDKTKGLNIFLFI